MILRTTNYTSFCYFLSNAMECMNMRLRNSVVFFAASLGMKLVASWKRTINKSIWKPTLPETYMQVSIYVYFLNQFAGRTVVTCNCNLRCRQLLIKYIINWLVSSVQIMAKKGKITLLFTKGNVKSIYRSLSHLRNKPFNNSECRNRLLPL